jgi:hypothetical protein
MASTTIGAVERTHAPARPPSRLGRLRRRPPDPIVCAVVLAIAAPPSSPRPVAVPAGSHAVRFSYGPRGHDLGRWLTISSGGFLLLAVLGEWWWPRRRRGL